MGKKNKEHRKRVAKRNEEINIQKRKSLKIDKIFSLKIGFMLVNIAETLPYFLSKKYNISPNNVSIVEHGNLSQLKFSNIIV